MRRLSSESESERKGSGMASVARTSGRRVVVKPGSEAAAVDEATPVNEVRLRGRVSMAGEQRELPSGDVVVGLRLVVPRGRRRTETSPTVDVVDLACWGARVRAAALRVGVGDEIEIVGALRRRFFRGGGGTQSRYEVEVGMLRRT